MTLLIPDADQEILWLYLAGRYFVDAIGRQKQRFIAHFSTATSDLLSALGIYFKMLPLFILLIFKN